MKARQIARVFLVVLFAVLLATPLLIKKVETEHAADKSKIDEKTAWARHGFYLQEVSHAVGIDTPMPERARAEKTATVLAPVLLRK